MPVTRPQVKLGALLWSQQTDWPTLREAAVAADRAGFDSLWISDHLLSPLGSWDKPIYEAWTTLAALGALTRRRSACSWERLPLNRLDRTVLSRMVTRNS